MNEFFAEPNKLSPKVWDLMEPWDGTNGSGIRTKLNKIIKEDPHVIDAYNLRFEILEHEGSRAAMKKEALRGYKAVLELIQDENGNFPDKIDWGWLENRSILRALANYAFTQWRSLKWEQAEEVMSRIINMNPNDNQGMCYCYLAVLERIAWTPFHDMFPDDEPEKLFEWFNKEGEKYEQFKGYMG